MTKPYSLDLRERVTEPVAAGDRVRAVATIFTVSVASVVRWSQRLRDAARDGGDGPRSEPTAHCPCHDPIVVCRPCGRPGDRLDRPPM
jgi:transposase